MAKSSPRVSVMRARFEEIPVVLASATPALESLHMANSGTYTKLELPSRFGGAQLPAIKLVDLTVEKPAAGRWLSAPLIEGLEARLDAGDKGGSSFGAYVLGLAFAFGWTPCIGPQLGAILSLAATEASVTRGTLLLGIYAAGLGIPFLLAAMFITRAMGLMNRIKRHMKLIERVMGGLLVAVGLAMVTGAFSRFAFWLLETFPALATLG